MIVDNSKGLKFANGLINQLKAQANSQGGVATTRVSKTATPWSNPHLAFYLNDNLPGARLWLANDLSGFVATVGVTEMPGYKVIKPD